MEPDRRAGVGEADWGNKAHERDVVPASSVLAIDKAEVERQRSAKWPDFHPELFCHRCGGRNVVGWTAPQQEWEAATQHLHRGDLAILCPLCFTTLYTENTGVSPVWEVRRWPGA